MFANRVAPLIGVEPPCNLRASRYKLRQSKYFAYSYNDITDPFIAWETLRQKEEKKLSTVHNISPCWRWPRPPRWGYCRGT